MTGSLQRRIIPRAPSLAPVVEQCGGRLVGDGGNHHHDLDIYLHWSGSLVSTGKDDYRCQFQLAL